MKVRMRLLLPVLLALSACATTPAPVADNTGPAVQTSAAPPQRVDAASNALGQRLDTMMANRHTTPTTLTR